MKTIEKKSRKKNTGSKPIRLPILRGMFIYPEEFKRKVGPAEYSFYDRDDLTITVHSQ